MGTVRLCQVDAALASCCSIIFPQMVITQNDAARSPSVAAADARFLKTRSKTCTPGPASHANLSGRRGKGGVRVLQQISKPVSQPSVKECKTKEGKNLTGHFWGRYAVSLAESRRGVGWVGAHMQQALHPHRHGTE